MVSDDNILIFGRTNLYKTT